MLLLPVPADCCVYRFTAFGHRQKIYCLHINDDFCLFRNRIHSYRIQTYAGKQQQNNFRKTESLYNKHRIHKTAITKKQAIHKEWLEWSGLRDSNSPPPPWQGGALPDELNPQVVIEL